MQLKPYLFVAAASFLMSCAEALQEYRAQSCDAENGYRQGFNDSRSGQPMNLQAAAGCLASDRPATEAGYRRGYQEGNSPPRTYREASVVPPGGVAFVQDEPMASVALRETGGDCFFGKTMALANGNSTLRIKVTVLESTREIGRPVAERSSQFALDPGAIQTLGCTRPSAAGPETSWRITGALYLHDD